MMAGIAIGVASLVIGVAGAAEGAHESHVANVQQKNAAHKQEASLLAQRQAAEAEQQKGKEKQAAAVSLARQRALSPASGGDFGGTLGSGAGGLSPVFSGASKTLLGA
jgi:uncharacterized membrane protein YdbT with pleckstrin-like domain